MGRLGIGVMVWHRSLLLALVARQTLEVSEKAAAVFLVAAVTTPRLG